MLDKFRIYMYFKLFSKFLFITLFTYLRQVLMWSRLASKIMIELKMTQKLLMFLFQLSKWSNYRCVPPHLVLTVPETELRTLYILGKHPTN